MARLHAFWVILAGNTPTAFHAKARDVLLPTLHQLQRTQPNVSLQWFERGRLWPSPAEARQALAARRQARPVRRPDWRPGGAHEDPRARFHLTRDQKRARFKKRPPRREPPSGRGPARTGKPPDPKDRK